MTSNLIVEERATARVRAATVPALGHEVSFQTDS